MPGLFSDYVIYADESGDHSLTRIDPEYPVFVLALCIFDKRQYRERVVPAVQDLKFGWFGHDMVVLHEREIRKQLPPFAALVDRQRENTFVDQLSGLLRNAPFRIVAAAIDKRALVRFGDSPASPYDLALLFCLERLTDFLRSRHQSGTTHVVFESRGRKEDDELRMAFDRISSALAGKDEAVPVDMIFADKKVNSTGMQIADMVARPIGLHVLRGDQPNRAFEVIRGKIWSDGSGRGLKIFPG